MGNTKTSKDYERKYTRPELRERLKEELKASSKGGRAGTWSARKSQLLAQRYEREGGGYRGGKGAPQRSLDRWTSQDWKTQSGGGRARDHGEMHRYLPDKAWRMLSPAEQRRADRSKVEERGGKQHVRWPKPVHDAMTAAGLTSDDAHDLRRADLMRYAKRLEIRGRSRMNKDDLVRALRRAK